MVRVFHDSDFISNHFGKNNPKVENLTLVAEVSTDNLEDAFRLTNHIDQDWWMNTEVLPCTDPTRSTSCGDLLEQDGRFYVTASVGFREVPAADREEAAIPAEREYQQKARPPRR